MLIYFIHCCTVIKYLYTYDIFLGALWGALENLNMIAQRILLANTTNPTSIEYRSIHNGSELTLSEDLIRLSRLTMILTFKAVQDLGNADQLLSLLNQDLINEEERQWLLAATPGELYHINMYFVLVI